LVKACVLSGADAAWRVESPARGQSRLSRDTGTIARGTRPRHVEDLFNNIRIVLVLPNARRGHTDGDYLFRTYDFFAVQESQREKMKRAIEESDTFTIQTGSVEQAADLFVQRFLLEVPELTEGAISVDVEESQIDVSGDRRRAFCSGRFEDGPHLVPGIRASYFVPFRGDRDLFKCQPNTYSSVVPFADLDDKELRFRFERPDQNVAETKKAFDAELSRVKEYLGWLRENVNDYNASLPLLARERVTARRIRLAELQRGTESLGVPIRRASTSPPAVSQRATDHRASAAESTARLAPRSYDVALTFAGEDRPIC